MVGKRIIIAEFEYAFSLVLDYLAEDDTKLVLLGDYIHGPDSVAVIKKIIELPRYYKEGNTIFVHAGIDEEAEDLWEWGTDEFTLTEKYPAQTGKFYNNLKIVAGHIGTATITNNPKFHNIFYDGESHYYIDGSVHISGIIPVLKVDTETDKYYCATK